MELYNLSLKLDKEEVLVLLDGIILQYESGTETFHTLGAEKEDILAWHEAVKELYNKVAIPIGKSSFEERIKSEANSKLHWILENL